LASYDRALKVRPDYAEALYNRGNTLHALKRFEEALASYDRALKGRPDYPDALSNRGLTRLLLGQYKDGWADHEWRWETKCFPSKRPKIDVPMWQGEDLSGRHLLVFSEQGLGDMIQFARYLPLLVKRKCRVTFFAPVQLKRLLELSFPPIEIVAN
jgi:tetratricopeptide (TPR) repeat protein